MNTREIRTKKPWRRILPFGYMSDHMNMVSGMYSPNGNENASEVVRQSDFLKEFYPSGHCINNPMVYPDITRVEEVEREDENGNSTGVVDKRYYVERVPRFAFAFQQIITIKQLVHTCGNDIQFELTKDKPTKTEMSDVNAFRSGWLKKDMEIRFYELVRSVKVTGDGAIVAWMDKGKFGCSVISYLNGDTLFPHYDSVTGKMNLFARSYMQFDEEGNESIEWLEVYDERNLSVYKKDKNATSTRIKEIFGLDGFSLVRTSVHGFNRIPVAYFRDDDGPCWSASQSSIEGYELSFSQMAHNNQAYGEPILVFQGENIDVQNAPNGTIKTLSMDTESKVSYLSSQSAADSYMKQLEQLYKMIFTQSFIVEPPELKSGDLPAAALKILYSPAVEKAMNDANLFQPMLNDIVELFSYGYGMEMERSIEYMSLPIKWWIKPYVHESTSSIVADLASSVQNGFLSRETASERISEYAQTNEWDRIIREKKEQQEADLLYQIETEVTNNNNE